jgi:hypothetical protein
VHEIRERLKTVRAGGVRIGFAIESGSRAWGFPSPDSDYDCRFVYVRDVDSHLALDKIRDVIEFPIVGDIDTGGWDLKKALQLALKGNAVIIEWVKSAIVYEEEAGFRDRLGSVLEQIVDPALAARHYCGLLSNHMSLAAGGEMKLKKLFYALRPALALHFMRERDFAVLPPMNMLEILSDVGVDDGLKAAIYQLVERKKMTREMGAGLPPDDISKFISETLAMIGPVLGGLTRDRRWNKAATELASDYYVREVKGHENPGIPVF